MKSFNYSVKSFNWQKWAALGLLLFIVLAIPVTLYEVQQQQTVNQHAAFQVPGTQHYACGSDLTVYLVPNGDSCQGSASGVKNGLTSFNSSIKIMAGPGSSGAYTVHWMWVQFFCENEDPHAPCYDHQTTIVDSTPDQRGITGDGSATVTATSSTRTPTAQFAGQACGYYQNDFGFYVTRNDSSTVLCGVSLDPNQIAHSTNNNASWCHSGNSCTVTTPTPTLPVTDTPTPPITITDTPTPPITITDTPTPPITDTPTPTATGTVTPGPTDTPTPVIVTTTPKPTLPPTGPSNTFVGIGLVGLAIVALGLTVIAL